MWTVLKVLHSWLRSHSFCGDRCDIWKIEPWAVNWCLTGQQEQNCVCVCARVCVSHLYCMYAHCQDLQQISVTAPKSCPCLLWMAWLHESKKKNMEAGLLQQEWKYRVSQAGARASCFAWVGIEGRISIFCSTEHLNVFTNAIWVTKIQQIFSEKTLLQCSPGCSIYIVHVNFIWKVEWFGWSTCMTQMYHFFPVNKAVVIGYVVISRWLSRWCIMLCFPFFSFSFSPPTFSCCVVSGCWTPCCVALCRDVLGLCCPVGLYQGRQWDRLHYSSNEICQCMGGLQSSSTTYHHTGEGEKWWDGGVRWDTKIGWDLAESCMRLCVCVCLSNQTLFNEALCMLRWQWVQTRGADSQSLHAQTDWDWTEY